MKFIFDKLTCLDHAVISNTGSLLGGSYIISIMVTVDSEYEVNKESLKYHLLDALSQFENNLWICADSKLVGEFNVGDTFVTTPKLHLKTTHYFINVDVNYSDVTKIAYEFNQFLEEELLEYLQPRLVIECSLTKPAPIDENGIFAFRYANGIGSSNSEYSSISGGKLAHFVLLDESYKPLSLESLQKEEFSQKLVELSFDLDSTYYINAIYCVEEPDNKIKITYPTDFGDFEMTMQNTEKVVQLPNEATLENICEYITPKFSAFKNAGAKYLRVTDSNSGVITEL